MHRTSVSFATSSSAAGQVARHLTRSSTPIWKITWSIPLQHPEMVVPGFRSEPGTRLRTKPQRQLIRRLAVLSATFRVAIRPIPTPRSDAASSELPTSLFEWAPPAHGSSPTTRFGQLYAYVFFTDKNTGLITETIASSPGQVGQPIPDFSNPDGPFLQINAGIRSRPTRISKDSNSIRACALSATAASRQIWWAVSFHAKVKSTDSEPHLWPIRKGRFKKYNQAVLKTVAGMPQRDDQGTIRPPHIAEVIRGWYAGCWNYCDDPPMSGTTQNGNFIPKGWRETQNAGTAPAGSESLYLSTVAPSCRTCHSNRELSLDFGTVANFNQDSDLLQVTLLPECPANNPDPKERPMPLVPLTYQRLWQRQPAAPPTPVGPHHAYKHGPSA